ncbi:tetratricopeptide repeat protein [Geomonas subterranea]|uniref:tetratricopeptide repeat protein n=1 Tax=Geomonas subterranea TaxID=2847989 RepID=UPI001CD806F5|nr:hypothetical protein [Geomonas fuzhouensis]
MKRYAIVISILLYLITPSPSYADTGKAILYDVTKSAIFIDGDRLQVHTGSDGRLWVSAEDVATFCKKKTPGDFGYLLLPHQNLNSMRTIDLAVFAEYIGAELDPSTQAAQLQTARELLKKVVELESDAELTYNKLRKDFCTAISVGWGDTREVCVAPSSGLVYANGDKVPEVLYDGQVSAEMNQFIPSAKSRVAELLGIESHSRFKLILLRCTETRFHYRGLLSDREGNEAEWNFTYDPRSGKITNYELDSFKSARDVVFFIAVNHLEQGRYDAAINIGSILLKGGKLGTGLYKREMIYRVIAQAYYRKGDAKKTGEYLGKYARVCDDPSELKWISDLCQELNRNEEAVAFATKAVNMSRTKDNKLSAMVYRAKLNSKLGRAEAAKNDFRNACKLGSDEACNFLLQ